LLAGLLGKANHVNVAATFNERGLFQYLNGWVRQADGEAMLRRQSKAEEVYFRATSALLAIDWMTQLSDACVREFSDFESEADVKDPGIVFWSPLVVLFLNELPGALGALRIMQDTVLPTFAAGRDVGVSVPLSLHSAIGRLHKIALPAQLKNCVHVYWSSHGKRLREYRDLDQHYSSVVRHSFLMLDEPRRLAVLLPDNPEARSEKDFKFDRAVNALDFVRDEFARLHELYEEIAKEEGATSTPLDQAVELSQLGRLEEGVRKTVSVMVPSVGTGRAIVLGQTEDGRITLVEALRPSASAANDEAGAS